MKWVVATALVAGLLAAGTAGAAALIDGGDVKNSSLTGADVKNKSLTKSDFRGSVQGPRGFRGSQGPQGPQGPAGPINVSGIQTVFGPENTTPANDIGSSIAFCPAGQRVISGGGFANNGGVDGLLASEANTARNGWFVIMADNTGFGGTIQAQALCAVADRAVVARNTHAETRREVARRIEALTARRH